MPIGRKDYRMGVNYNYGLWAFSLFFTAFLLVLTCINHSRETKRYQILKLSLWILLANQLFDIFRIKVRCEGVMYAPQVVYVIFVGYYLTAATVMTLIIMYMLLQFPQLAEREQFLHTIFFLCECTAAILILPTNLTGLVYSIEEKRFNTSIGDEVILAVRLIDQKGN